MSKSKNADPAPKPDHIRALRDLAANFVRAIDRTALEYEGVATADLAERMACLAALHELETTEAELTKTPTKNLRERLSLLRQVGRAEHDCYQARFMTNGELKKRIEYLRLFTAAEAEFDNLSDERLAEVSREVASTIATRKREAKAAEKAEARARSLRVVSRADYAPDAIEEEADVSDIIEEDEAAA
jgi:hypothetical protein